MEVQGVDCCAIVLPMVELARRDVLHGRTRVKSERVLQFQSIFSSLQGQPCRTRMTSSVRSIGPYGVYGTGNGDAAMNRPEKFSPPSLVFAVTAHRR